MKAKTVLIVALATVSALASASLPAPLAKYVSAIHSANALEASYTVQEIGGSKGTYKVQLAKPNMVKIDMPGKVITVNGDQMMVFMKAQKEHYTKAVDATGIQNLFAEPALRMWAPFFSENAYDNLAATVGDKVRRKGMELTPVKTVVDSNTGKTLTFLFAGNGDLKQNTIELTTSDKTSVIDFTSLLLKADASKDAFALKAPEGSKEIQEADLASADWFTDYDAALAEATKTNRKVLIDCFATWCGPCKMLEKNVHSTAEFKALSKEFVFLKIDVDAQKDIAEKYNIEAMPTTIVTDNTGAEIGRFVGYVPVAEYLAEIRKIVGN
ncbi:MAG: thioredoxin family protein [Armatimonadetes bacterium]|nr:thioredoxin family protein [Armatimonadota bacterium]